MYDDQIRRINSVILFIEHNLFSDLTIDELAKIACYSKFHFNRIFKSIMKESVYHYINRLRIERSNHYLWASDYSIKEIAIKCGFNTSSNFSYNYKKHFGISAKKQRDIYKYYQDIHKYHNEGDLKVELKTLPNLTFAYVKNVGDYKTLTPDGALKLFKWGKENNFCKDKFDLHVLAYDSPYITEEGLLRADLCIAVPEDTKPDGEISIMSIPYFRVASIKVPKGERINHYRDDIDAWIMDNGYETVIGIPTIYINNNLIGKNDHIDDSELELEICVVIKQKIS